MFLILGITMIIVGILIGILIIINWKEYFSGGDYGACILIILGVIFPIAMGIYSIVGFYPLLG